MCSILVYFITGIDLEGMHECVSGVMRKFLLLSCSRGRWSICSRNHGTSKGPLFPGMTPWELQGALIFQPDPVRLAGDRDFPAWPVGSVGDPDFPAERLAGFVPGRMVPSSTLGQRLYWNDQLVSLLSVFFPVVMFNFNYLISCP